MCNNSSVSDTKFQPTFPCRSSRLTISQNGEAKLDIEKSIIRLRAHNNEIHDSVSFTNKRLFLIHSFYQV